MRATDLDQSGQSDYVKSYFSLSRFASSCIAPDRGVDGAPTGALFNLGRACDARPPVPGRPEPLSALHRGGFRMRTHEAGSRQWDRSRSDCPRQATRPGGRGPDLPTVRFAPQSRDATPSSVSRIVSGRRPLLSQDANRIAYIRYVVKIFLRIVVNILAVKATENNGRGSPCEDYELRNRTTRMRRVRYEQQRPVIASATRSSSLSRSCAWSCVCAWEDAGGGTPVSAIGSSCGSPCRRISARLILVAAGSILFVSGSNTAP